MLNITKKILALARIAILACLIISSHSNLLYAAQQDWQSKVLQSAKRAVVTINSHISISAYQKDLGSSRGTGFIVDKKRGLIVTNQHIVGIAAVGTYYVNFYNGKKAQAKLLYYDIWQDYAILEVNPEEIPLESENIVFSTKKPKLNQEVIVVGNAEAAGFSVHLGNISSLQDVDGAMPQCSYLINLNSAGGASGSPILIGPNEAIGVLYGGAKTYVLALHAEYVQRALDAIYKGELPRRRHIGVILNLYSIDNAVKYRGYPLKNAQQYLKDFPEARNNVLEVQVIIAGSTAENLLKSGDLVLAVNGQALGANLAMLDRFFDESKGDTVKISIYREKEGFMEKEIKLYDINKNKVSKIVDFAGAFFFEADDYMANFSGIPIGSLTLANARIGSSFDDIGYGLFTDNLLYYRLQIQKICGETVSSLDDLLKVIPSLIAKKYITSEMKSYMPYYLRYTSSVKTDQPKFISDIDLNSIDNRYRKLEFDLKAREWKAHEMAMPAAEAVGEAQNKIAETSGGGGDQKAK